MSSTVSPARLEPAPTILSFPATLSEIAKPSGGAHHCEADGLRSALWNALPDPVLIVDPKTGQILDANSAVSEWLSCAHESLLGGRIFEFLPDLVADDLKGRVGRRVNRQRVAPNALLIRGITVAGRATDVRCSPFIHEGQNLILVMLRAPQLDERSQVAFSDPLTGLPDRRWFDRRMRRVFRRAKANADCGFAVLFVDLDRFKPVNDEHGHPIGDEVLCAVAQRLLRCVRPQDMVSRRGGDEFTVLLDGVVKDVTARRVAERIMRGLEAPVSIEGREFTISASVGISVWSPDHAHPSELLADADVSMYRVKRAGGKGYAYGFTRHDKLSLAN